MFDIGNDKAPGPDGYSAAFYKNSWSIVGDEVCDAIKDFFKNGKLLREVNSTLISLIPKTKHPSKISEYRPIACCNVLYKCISKILTNRIKSSLCKLVNQNQSAFVPGRLFTILIYTIIYIIFLTRHHTLIFPRPSITQVSSYRTTPDP